MAFLACKVKQFAKKLAAGLLCCILLRIEMQAGTTESVQLKVYRKTMRI